MPQVELDKENDYYMRPASPAHTYDPYADDEHVGVADRSDPYDTYHPESVRRIAPPPPPDFVAREERERSRYHEPGPGPRPRHRIAPPRSPSPHGGVPPRGGGRVAPPPPAHYGHGPPGAGPPPGGRFRGGEDWADPWMRGGPDRGRGGGGPGGRGPPGADRCSTTQSSWSFPLAIHQVRPQEELQQRQQQEQLGVEQVSESAAPAHAALLLVLLQPLLLALPLPQQHAARHPAPRS